MDFEKIEAFLTVASAGKFTTAAEKLFISQSSLSKQMAHLEKELGVKLFKKTRNGVLLTQAGHDFYSYARQALSENQRAVARLQMYREDDKRPLILGALPLTEEYGLSDAFSSYWVHNPSVQIEFIERSQENLVDRLRRNKIDLALIRVDLIDAHEFSHIPLLADDLEVVCSTKHPLARSKQLEIAELRNEQFVMMEEKSDIYQLVKRACVASGFYPSVPFHHSRHRMLLKAVENNMGLTVIPKRLLEAYPSKDLVGIPLATPIRSTLGLTWSASRTLTPMLEDFINYICGQFGVDPKTSI